MTAIIQAGVVPLLGVAFGEVGEPAVAVNGAHPLPVVAVRDAIVASPLSGTSSALAVVSPFVPDLVAYLGPVVWQLDRHRADPAVDRRRHDAPSAHRRGAELGDPHRQCTGSDRRGK